jgi:hypothetical protein
VPERAGAGDRRRFRRRWVIGVLVSGTLAVSGLAAAVVSATTDPARVRFPAAAAFDYQIGGAYRPPAGVEIVDRDRSATPVAGLYNICYVNAYQAQTDQVSWWQRHHSDLLLHTAAGKLVIDPNWGEPLLDTSTPAKRAALARIVGGWIDGCARAGFQAVEPDNLDSFSRSDGLLTLDDNLAFAARLASAAHADGLDIAQKNLAENSSAVHARGYDFAISEQCEQYQECGSYTRTYGRSLIDIEYVHRYFVAACRRYAGRFSIEYRDLEVVPKGSRGYADQRCG